MAYSDIYERGNDIPVFSSEKAPHIYKAVKNLTLRKIWCCDPNGVGNQDWPPVVL
jgi:hypothetical protein